MSKSDQNAEIFTIYEKHGWILRRILVTKSARDSVGIQNPEITIAGSDIDAAWFSRPHKSGGIPWEIRYLGEPPFALLENLDESDPDFEERLRNVENRLKATVTSKKARPSVINYLSDDSSA